MENFILGVTLFTGIILALVAIILIARSMLVASGAVEILINDERTIKAPAGSKLLGALGRHVALPPNQNSQLRRANIGPTVHRTPDG